MEVIHGRSGTWRWRKSHHGTDMRHDRGEESSSHTRSEMRMARSDRPQVAFRISARVGDERKVAFCGLQMRRLEPAPPPMASCPARPTGTKCEMALVRSLPMLPPHVLSPRLILGRCQDCVFASLCDSVTSTPLHQRPPSPPLIPIPHDIPNMCQLRGTEARRRKSAQGC